MDRKNSPRHNDLRSRHNPVQYRQYYQDSEDYSRSERPENYTRRTEHTNRGRGGNRRYPDPDLNFGQHHNNNQGVSHYNNSTQNRRGRLPGFGQIVDNNGRWKNRNTTPSFDVDKLPPDPPSSFRFVYRIHGEINFEWDHPNDQGSEITDYLLQYSMSNNNYKGIKICGNEKSFASFITKPSTTHYFRLFAINFHGTSNPSKTIEFKTDAEGKCLKKMTAADDEDPKTEQVTRDVTTSTSHNLPSEKKFLVTQYIQQSPFDAVSISSRNESTTGCIDDDTSSQVTLLPRKSLVEDFREKIQFLEARYPYDDPLSMGQKMEMERFVFHSTLPLTRDSERIKVFIKILKIFLDSRRFLEQENYTYRKNKEMLYLFDQYHQSIKQLTLIKAPIHDWKDKYGMTLMMNMITDEDESKHLRVLVELIIKEEKYFDAKYICTRAIPDLGVQFQLQHCQNIIKYNKFRNTVINPGQTVLLKKCWKVNCKADIQGMKIGQFKMISKEKVKLLQYDGTIVEERIMITARFAEKKIQNDEVEVLVKDDNLYMVGDKEPLTDYYISFDIYDEESNEIVPEHFDSQSVKSKSSNTFIVNGEEYVYSESVSTKVMETPKACQQFQVNENYSKNTSLLLLACKTKKWNIWRSIMELDKDKYKILFTTNDRDHLHPLNCRDDSNATCLDLSLEDRQMDISKFIIQNLDIQSLKSVKVSDLEKIKNMDPQYSSECREMQLIIEENEYHSRISSFKSLLGKFLSKANINFDVEQVVEELEYVDPEWQEEANKNPNAYAEKIVDKLRAKG